MSDNEIFWTRIQALETKAATLETDVATLRELVGVLAGRLEIHQEDVELRLRRGELSRDASELAGGETRV